MKDKIQRLNLIFDQDSTAQTRFKMDYIEIKGYKSIRHAKVEIKPINILIGGNGAGKSNFISFFEFLTNLYDQKLQNYVALNGGMDRFLFQGQKVTNELSGKVSFDNGENGYSFCLKAGATNFVVERETLIIHGKSFSQTPNSLEANLKFDDASEADLIRVHLKANRVNHFHDTGRYSPFSKESHVENDVFFLYKGGDNLAAFLFSLKNKYPKTYHRIVSVVQSVAPFFLDFYLAPNENGFVRLQWQDKFCESVYGPTNLSDGTMRFIALTVLFLQPNLPKLLIIDEPELGLHPTAIVKLGGLVQSAAGRGAQVIVSTQSSDLVDCFDVEDIITVDQRNGETSFTRLKAEDLAIWIDDYSLGDLWKQSIIRGGQT